MIIRERQEQDETI